MRGGGPWPGREVVGEAYCRRKEIPITQAVDKATAGLPSPRRACPLSTISTASDTGIRRGRRTVPPRRV